MMSASGKTKGYVIKIAENSGFCFGVKRATENVEAAIRLRDESAEHTRIFTLGHLIHNDTYVERLEHNGVFSITAEEIEATADSATKLSPVKLFLRAHGVTLETERMLDEMSRKNPYFEYVDCTCPFVKKIHRIAAENQGENNVFILIGKSTHPEVVGILSYFEGKKFVFSGADELSESLQKGELSKLHKYTPILAAQTTLDLSEWEKCQKVLKKLCTNSIIFDTICSVTEKRQTEAEYLSGSCDMIVVVGGRESSNTAKLHAICRRHCDNTVWVESADELSCNIPFNIYRKYADAPIKAGIIAGASTPSDIIQEVFKTMSENFEKLEGESFEELLESSFKTLNIGDIVVGTVTLVTDAELQLDIVAKNTGVIQAEQITDDPSVKLTSLYKVGDQVEGFVIRVSDVDGFAYLSKKRVDSDRNWQNIANAKDNDTVLEGKVIEAVKGGVVVLSDSVKVFIPASQTGVPRDGDLTTLVGTDVKFKIIDIKPGKKAIGSIRTVLAAERKARVEEFWSNIEVGKRYNGIVKNLTKYGAFIDLGGVDGLILVSELTWKRVSSPESIVKVGDTLDVYVKSFDPEKRKIVLGHKTEDTNPWYIFSHNYNVGDVVSAKIVNIVDFGAFAEIVEGVDGLIHVTQIPREKNENNEYQKIEDVISVGQYVDVKIVKVDEENKKVSLSMKAVFEASEDETVEETAEEAPADAE